MSVPVDFQDGQVLKTQTFRKSLKSKVLFLFREKSFAINSFVTMFYYILDMTMTKSKCIESRRRGSFFVCCFFVLCGFVPERCSLNVLFFMFMMVEL